MMYRKKPVVIEALQWDGSMDGMLEINKHWPLLDTTGTTTNKVTRTVFMWNIKTLEGQHRVGVGDYIIKGVKGEFYPCKPDIFAMTYESALAVSAPTQAQPAKPTPTKFEVLAITTAYEQGVGKGQQSRDVKNPYAGYCAEAWQLGYAHGQENKATQPAPTPTQAQHLKAAAQQALIVLRGCLEHPGADDAISALQHAIAQPAKPATALTEAEIFKTLTSQCVNLTEACVLLQRKFCEVNGITLKETP